MSSDEFDWWFDGNPAGSLRSVAVMDGRIVGVAAHSLYRVVLDGEERRGERLGPRGDRPFGARPRHLRRAGAKARARGDGARRRLRTRVRERADRAAFPRAARLDGDREASRVGAAGVREACRAEAAPELDLQGDAASAWPNHVIRDTEYLRWRYLESPRGYEAVESGSGYAVVWPAKRHKGRTIAVVADHVGDTNFSARRARRARSRLFFALPAPEQRRAYLTAGFLPTPQTLNFMGKALAGRLDTDPRAWRVTLGDTDFF